MKERFPAIFFGHGSPMNAIQTNAYTKAWQRIGEQVGKPRAMLAISAHWYIGRTAVTTGPSPRTIHDFGGFPPELYQVQYPAPGDVALGRRVQELLSAVNVSVDASWGLDHGTWSVLRHAYPDADVPIVQLSIDATQPASFHYEIGRALAPLRGEDILIVGSGNLVHNLRRYAWDGEERAPYDWATRFEEQAKTMIVAGNYAPLVDYETMGVDAALSIPTPEHFLPLLYVLGSGQPDDVVRFPVSGVQGGSISMLCVQLGA